jgi:hypothetical protein|tara:strand:+ start:176 stop:802 length:627 start_codon:yes stop_codon:yes gene_type:complete
MNFKDTIGVYPNAFTKQECKELINSFEEKIKDGRAIKGESSSGANDSKKLTIDYNIFNSNEQKDIELRNMVAERFNHYLSNEYFFNYPHGDIFNHSSVVDGKTFYPAFNLQKYINNKGHYNAWHTERDHYGVTTRLFVFILYLNNVKEGGETKFLFKENKNDKDFYSVSPEVGKLIIHPASWPYIHKGAMPKSNDKYILTTWLQYTEV